MYAVRTGANEAAFRGAEVFGDRALHSQNTKKGTVI